MIGRIPDTEVKLTHRWLGRMPCDSRTLPGKQNQFSIELVFCVSIPKETMILNEVKDFPLTVYVQIRGKSPKESPVEKGI